MAVALLPRAGLGPMAAALDALGPAPTVDAVDAVVIADRWMGKSKKGKKGKKGAAGKKGKKGKKGQGGAVIGGPSTKGPKSIKKRNCKVRCKGDKACMSKCKGKK